VEPTAPGNTRNADLRPIDCVLRQDAVRPLVQQGAVRLDELAVDKV
jgi:hypothetical protein